MSITYPLSLPGSASGRNSVPGFVSQEWTERRIASVTRSIFTGSMQVQAFQGQWLECVVTVAAMSRAEAEPWAALLALVNSGVGSLMLGDSLSVVHGSLGVASGTPLVKGAGQTGNVLLTDGWTNSITGIVKAGDFLSFGVAKEHLYKVMKDADSDSSGNCSIDIFPSILDSTTDDDVISLPGLGQFKILDSGKYSYGVDQICKGLTFTAVQDI